MRRLLALAVLVGSLAIVLKQSEGEDKAKPAGTEFTVGNPIKYGNLTIFPLSSRVAKTANRFITLDEGLKAGSVKIMEMGSAAAGEAQGAAANSPPARLESGAAAPLADNHAGAVEADAEQISSDTADVNHLLVLNRAKKSLYLMPGEIIIGGEQDRTIAQEYVIEPSAKPTTIEVFCVEHGRWHGREAVETATIIEGANSESLARSNSLAGGQTDAKQLAEKAKKGEFIGSLGNVNKSARVAVQGTKDQGEVWDKVAAANAKSANKSQSGDFAGNYAEPETVKHLEPYVKALETPVAEQSQVVGVAVAIDGKLDTLDVFESTPLFRQLWPKLLKSYALDAANATADDEAESASAKPGEKSTKPAPKACTVEDARRFVAEALTATGKESKGAGVDLTAASTEHLLTFSAQDSRRSRDAQSPAGAGGFGGGGFIGGGGFGGGIHGAGFAK